MQINGKVVSVTADDNRYALADGVLVVIHCPEVTAAARDEAPPLIATVQLRLSHAAAKAYPVDRRVVLKVEPR